MGVTYTKKSNSTGLVKLKKTLEVLAKTTVKVGVLAENNKRHEERVYEKGKLSELMAGATQNNAQVGYNMEKGVSSDGGSIPKRSWLVDPLVQQLPDALKAPSQGVTLTTLPDFIAIRALEVVKTTFDTAGNGNWEGNAPGTIAAKGRDEPGVDTGQLKNAISYKVE